MGGLAIGRKSIDVDGSPQLRDIQNPDISRFETEKRIIEPKNTYYWDIFT